MLMRDIKKVTIEEAYEIYNTMGLSFNISSGKLKGIRVETKGGK